MSRQHRQVISNPSHMSYYHLDVCFHCSTVVCIEEFEMLHGNLLD